MAKEHKERIQQRITAFATEIFADNALALFKELGYESNKRIALDKGAFEGLFAEHQTANAQKAFFDDWLSADYLFQLTEEEITRQKSLFSVNQYNPNEFQSYSFVAIELKNEHYARGRLSQITREVNKLFPMPVMILFKHGSSLTLSVINRRLHKRDDSKDVLEKVTLIKDIRISPAGGGVRRTGVEIPLKKGGEGVVSGEGIVSGGEAGTHRAHIEILFDLSFDELKNKHGFTNFVEMHNAWQETLDTSELNKRFFRELANWYFWAMDNVEFPDDLEKKKDVRNATSVIRLITRLMFVWFLKEKDLVQDDLFNQEKLEQLLSFKDKNKSTYYKAILQNLFFATLNTEMNKDKPDSRKFRHKAREQGLRDQHYMIHNVFRYEDYFINPLDTFIKYFDNIPFLNGGLFECLDKKVTINGKDEVIRVDGFSDHPKNVLKVPDELFFSPEQQIDLNKIYDTRNRTYKVRGLINILNSYKFTVHENTPIEEEVALDPELLGKVFENLLASYNPETETTARKLTGSFYTPREKVNYMVDESLIAYLQTQLIQKLPKLDKEGEERIEAKLRHLFSYTDEEHQFTPEEVNILIEAIDNIKILDPACGSGAFPMGILHKLVYILSKIDPENEQWKQRQINKVSEISDSTMREKFLEDIEQSFQNNELDYGRKLYLIENCIYGVDIQPIAVQIAKLRFFISLIVDQKVDIQKENLGIRPLPNLETKFIAANSLIGIGNILRDKNEQRGQRGLRSPEIERKEKELEKVRERYFTARTPQTKEKYRKEDERLRGEILELLQKGGWPSETTKQLASWNPYDQNTAANFFDPEWMFGVTNGFDVVIANPPYGADLKDTLEKLEATYQYYDRQKNSASFFIELASRLVKNNGVVTYIVPKSLSFSEGWQKTRKLIADIYRLLTLVDVSKAFDAVLLEQIIISFIKSKSDSYEFNTGEGWSSTINSIGTVSNSLIKEHDTFPVYIDKAKLRILEKISKQSILLSEISYTFRGLPLQRNISEKGLPILRGRNIGKYKIYGKIDKISLPQELINSKKIKDILLPKIVSQNIVAHVLNPYDRIIIMATLDKEPFLTLDTVMNTVMTNDKFAIEYVISILNSKLASWFYYWFVYNRSIRTMHFDKYYIGKLPIKNVHLSYQKPFINLVDQIFAIKQKDPQADTLALESQIDVMVYKLYELTYEEVKIVDPEFAMSEVEYEACEVK